MATFKSVQTYTVEVNNSDNENRAFDLRATARVDYGNLSGIDNGEIRRLPAEDGTEGEYIASFGFYANGGSINLGTGDVSLADAAAIAEEFRSEIESAINAQKEGGEA